MTKPFFKRQKEDHYSGRKIYCFKDRWKSVLDVFIQATLLAPEKEAIICDNRRLTYSALNSLAARFASALISHGIEKKSRFAIHTSNRLEFVVAYIGCLKAGVICVPISAEKTSDELLEIYKAAGVSGVLFDDETKSKQPGNNTPKSLKLKISIDVKDNDALDFYSFILAPAQKLPILENQEEECIALLYANPQKGEKPKGVMLTNLSLVHSLMHYIEGFKLRENEVTIASSSLAEIPAFIMQMHIMFVSMGKLVLAKEFAKDEFIKLAEEEKLTISLLPKSAYKTLEKTEAKTILTEWHIGLFDEFLPQEMNADIFPKVTFFNGIQCAECSACGTLISNTNGLKEGAYGKAVSCAEIKIVDAKGKKVALGEVGEFLIKGSMVVPGYWQDTKANKAKFKNGFWKSGIFAFQDKDGNVFLKP